MKNREKAMVEAAILYYEEGLTQTEITKKLNVSRPTVASLLKEAKETGIVKITIQDNGITHYKKQNEIKKKYKLETVLIAGESEDEQKNKIAVGTATANYVESRLKDIKKLGIGWGTTLYEFVQATDYVETTDLTIIPMMGGVGSSEIHLHSNHLVFTLAQKYNAKEKMLYAPAIAESKEMKKILNESETVTDVLNSAKSVDLAIIGVGNPIESSTYKNMGYVSEIEREEINNSEAIGDILATFFNEKGKPVNTSVSERMIGSPLEDINEMKEVLIVASGEEKIQSIKTLLGINIIDHLIIDKKIADKL